MASQSFEGKMFTNQSMNTFSSEPVCKIENHSDDITSDQNVATHNEAWENNKSSDSVNNLITNLSIQRNVTISNLQNLESITTVDSSMNSVDKCTKGLCNTKYFEVPFDCKERSNYVHLEEITIKEEKDDVDREDNLITIEIKLENEGMSETKVPEMESIHINSCNTDDPEEILPTNDYCISAKPILDTHTRNYLDTVSKDSTSTCGEHDFYRNSQIEVCHQKQSKAPRYSEKSVSCFDSPENILSTISEENTEEILPTIDPSKDNLLKPTKLQPTISQPAKVKPKYKCSECHASYQSLSHYRAHKKVHLNLEVQKSKKGHRNPIKRVTNVRGFPHFKCDKCDQKYIYGTSLEKHMSKCHAPFPVQLVKGSEILSNTDSKIESVNMNDNYNSIKVMPDSLIPDHLKNNALTFAETSELEHIMDSILKLQQCSVDASRDMLNEIEKKYDCPKCFQSFNNSSKYKCHLHKHIKDEKQFLGRRKSQLSRKYAKVNRGFTHFVCEKCNKKYSLFSSLKKHMKNCLIEVKDEPPDYLCTCKKIFSKESDMLLCFKAHEAKPADTAVHDAEDNDAAKWPLTDNYISLLKADSTAEALMNNIKLLEQDINILNSKMATISESSNEVYECPKCFMSYSITRSYRAHLNRHLGQANRVLKKKKMAMKMKLLKARNDFASLICDPCKYVSTDEKDLENHKMTCRIGEESTNSGNTLYSQNTDISINVSTVGTQGRGQCDVETISSNNACTSVSRSNSLQNTNNLSAPSNNEPISEQVPSDFSVKEIGKGGETQKIHRCPKCSMFYINFSEFQQHLIKHNEEEMRILPQKMRVKTMRLFKESTNLKCDKCNKIYVYEESLNRHMRQCQKPAHPDNLEMNVYPCVCGKTFSRKTRMESCFQSHGAELLNTGTSVGEYNTNTAYKDGDCFKESLSTATDKVTMELEEKLKANELSNTMLSSQTHKCTKCPMLFRTLLEYKHHVSEHREENESRQDPETGVIWVKRVKDVRGFTRYKCNQCDKTYMHKDNLETHVNSQHKTEETVPVVDEGYPCTCGKIFLRKSRMETCLKNHNRVNMVKLLYCSTCSYYFENQNDLHLHKRVAHVEDRLLCKMCPMEYPTPSQLFEHLKLHQNIQLMEHKIVEENAEKNQKFRCFICECHLSDLTDLKFHFLNDHKQPYSCKECDESFVEIKYFMSHTKTFHLLSQEKPIMEFLESIHGLIESWKCEPCKFECKNPDELADHMHNHKTMNAVKFDPFRRIVVDTKKYRCIDCRRIFKAPSTRRRHVELYHNICDLHSELEKQKFILCTKSTKKDVDTATPTGQYNTCFTCKMHFISEMHLKWHLSTQKHMDIRSCLLNEQFFQENCDRAASPEPTPKFFEVMLIKQEFIDDCHSDNE